MKAPRGRSFRFPLLALLAMVLCARTATAQAAGPYAAYVYPAGGQRGTTFAVTVAGQGLGGPQGVEISGQGVSARVLGFVGKSGPLTKVQEEELRLRLQELAARPVRAVPAGAVDPASGRGATAGPRPALPDLPELRNLESKSRAELKLVADQFLNRDKRPKPPMDELVSLEVSIDSAAEPGDRALRLRTRSGLSNPLMFQVGLAAEMREPGRFEPALAEPPMIKVPAVVNGQIFPGEVDRFRLSLRKGERVDLAVRARHLIPYIADAVPGWFQAVLAITGPDGRPAAYCDDAGLDPDPRLAFRAPAAGLYTVEVRDSIYRGREDFVYRLEVSAGGGAGVGTSAATASDALTTAASRGGPRTEVSPVVFPAAVRGVLREPGLVHAYEFTGSAGEIVVAEIRARRQGSPLDSFVRLRDAGGRIIASNDDTEDKECGLLTYHADSYLRVALPAAGTYRLEVLDTTGRGGADYAYTLDLRRPAPDLAVFTTVSALNAGRTGSAAFAAVAVRKDGWQGDIAIRLRRPQRGFTLEGGLIPAGRDSAPMTLTAHDRGADQSLRVELEAVAQIGGVEVVRSVRPADLRMQAFGNTHLVPAEALWVTASRNRPVEFTAASAAALSLRAGASAELALRHPPLPLKSLRAALVNPPAGIKLAGQRWSPDGLVLALSADAAARPGTENLILSLKGVVEPPAPKAGGAQPAAPAARVAAPAPAARPRESDLGVLPALVVKVVPKDS